MKLLLIEDHPIFRLGVRELLESKWPGSLLLEADSVASARQALPPEGVDAIILDLSLPDASGAEAATRALAMARGAPIIVLSASGETGVAARLLKMGIADYVSKNQAAEALLEAIGRVTAGGRFVSPDLAEKLIGKLSGKEAGELLHESLSTQEYRVMLLIAAGLGPSQIAESMALSVKTVSTYRARLLFKGEWTNNTELTKYCIKHGLTGQD